MLKKPSRQQTAKTESSPVQVRIEELIAIGRDASRAVWPPAMVRSRQGGNYLSRFKGRGMEFDEVRLYQAGDDVRSIDWRVTARTGKPHTKLFREERERPVIIAVDYRRPMFFATRGIFKSVFAARAAALLAWTALKHGDRVGGMIYTDDRHHEIKPARSRSKVLRFLLQLCTEQQADSGGSMAAHSDAMLRLRRMVHPGSLCVLISDFRAWDQEMETHLNQLNRHSQLMLVSIHDPLEAELPPAGLYRISDGERETMVDTTQARRVAAYRDRFAQQQARMKKFCTGHGILLLDCSTRDDPAHILTQQFGLRYSA